MDSPDSITFEYIGEASSPFEQKLGIPRQSGLVPHAHAFLWIYPKFQPQVSLSGLDGYSHIWVLFHFHQNTVHDKNPPLKVSPPRLEGQKIGVFATRSPHRPNPIGLSSCRLEKIEEQGLWVSGVDLLDQTPILDIKPYIALDIHSQARSPIYKRLAVNPILSENASNYLKSKDQKFRNMVLEIMQYDFRPQAYKAKLQENMSKYKYKQTFKIRLAGHELVIAFQGEDCILQDIFECSI